MGLVAGACNVPSARSLPYVLTWFSRCLVLGAACALEQRVPKGNPSGMSERAIDPVQERLQGSGCFLLLLFFPEELNMNGLLVNDQGCAD
jgi:hypothetical protein